MSDPSINPKEEGVRLLQSGDLDGALGHLEMAAQRDPSDARAQAYLGICRTRKGDAEGGIAALRQAVRLSPADAVFRHNLGVALSQAGRPAEAVTELEQALVLNPSHAGARELLHRLRSAPAAPPSPAPTPPPAAPTAFAPPSVPTPTSGQPTTWSAPGASAAEAAPTWNPAAPAEAPPAWGATPSAPQGGPPAWNPAPQGDAQQSWTPAPAPGDATQHGDYTGSPAAMYYAQDQTYGGKPPGLGRRLLRGWLWGIVYGQWWTLWSLLSDVLFGRASMDPKFFIATIIQAFFYGFFGSLVGLTIAAANLDEDQGTYVGVGAGMLVLGLELLLSGSAFGLINVFFYFFTGRYVGRGVAGRIQQPV